MATSAQTYWQEGHDAFPNTDCPYLEGFVAADFWWDGWEEAHIDFEEEEEANVGFTTTSVTTNTTGVTGASITWDAT